MNIFVKIKSIFKKGLDYLFNPLPSFFDFLISLMLIINFIQADYIKEIFFVFYTLFLLCLTFVLKPEREYKNFWLGVLAIWALGSVFIHSFFLSKESITFQYKNMYLMSEGFIYILAGILFLTILIRYSTNLKFLFLLSPLLLKPWIFDFSKDSHLTPFVALYLSILIYSLIKKKNYASSILFWSGLFIFTIKHNFIITKFRFKIPVMKELLDQITRHPIVGNGFNESFSPYNKMILIPNQQFQWFWRYNDFLNLGSQLGAIALILSVLFALSTLKNIKSGFYLILAITMLLIMSSQSIMFFTDKATTCLLLIGLIILSSYKKEEICLRN